MVDAARRAARVLLPALDRVIETLAALARQLAAAGCSRAPTAAASHDARQVSSRTWFIACAAGTRSLGVTDRKMNARGQLQRPCRRVSGLRLERFAKAFVESLGLEFNPTPSRSSRRQLRRAVRRVRARQHVLLDLDRDCGVTFRSLLKQKTKAAKSAPRHAAQSHPSIREFPRVISESRTRCAHLSKNSRCRAAAGSVGLDGAAEVRRRLAQSARLRVLPEGSGQARRRSCAHAQTSTPTGNVGERCRRMPATSSDAYEQLKHHARQGVTRSDARFHPRLELPRPRSTASQAHAQPAIRQGRELARKIRRRS